MISNRPTAWRTTLDKLAEIPQLPDWLLHKTKDHGGYEFIPPDDYIDQFIQTEIAYVRSFLRRARIEQIRSQYTGRCDYETDPDWESGSDDPGEL